MNQWINQFLENEIVNRTDKTDKTDKSTNARPLSVLSVRPLRLLDEKKVENNLETGTDKTDRLGPNLNLSGLSGRPQDVLETISSLYADHEFEERLAIAEYDGGKTSLHAQRIAYLDAFISTLTALPATDSQKDWLDQQIQISLAWVEAQSFHSLN